MSKAIQHNFVYSEPVLGGYLTAEEIQEAINALYENHEKIICVVPTRFNKEGRIEQLFITTEVEY